MHWDLGSHKSVEKLGNGNYVFFCIFIYFFFFNIKETPRIYLFFPPSDLLKGKKKKNLGSTTEKRLLRLRVFQLHENFSRFR